MNEIPKKTQNLKPKNGQQFSYRKQGNIRVLHKTQVPTITKNNSIKINAYTSKSPTSSTTNKKISRGSYQYSNTKRGNRKTRQEVQGIQNKIIIQKN